MATPLNILIAEDSPDDAELLLIELRRAGFDPKWKRVETERDFLTELNKLPDIVLSDFSMPQFTGLRAAELLRERGLSIPFILISGTVGEDVAVEAMKHGATDYLLKDRIARLGSAVRQALEKEQFRQESEKLRRKIIIREQQLNAFFTGAIAGLALLDLEMRYVQINATLADMNGLSAKDHIGRTIREVLPRFAPLIEPMFQKVLTTGEPILNVELTGETPKQPGVQRHWAESIFPTLGKDGKPDGLGVIVVDITNRKWAELALQESEEKFRKIFENVQDVFYQTDNNGKIIEISPSIERYSGYRREELIGKPVEEVYHNQEDRAKLLKTLSEKGEVVDYELQLKTKNSSLVYTSVNAHILIDSKGEPRGVEGALRDITARKRAEEEIRNQLNELQRWHEVMLGREERILELKREVNELLDQQRLPPRYSDPSVT